METFPKEIRVGDLLLDTICHDIGYVVKVMDVPPFTMKSGLTDMKVVHIDWYLPLTGVYGSSHYYLYILERIKEEEWIHIPRK